MMKRLLKIFICIVFVSSISVDGYSQKVIATIKIIKDKLQGRNLDLFEGLEVKLQNYINNYNWAKNNDDTPLDIDVQIFLEKVSDVGENRRVNATFFITNSREMQFLDNSCIFSLKKGTSYYHDETIVDPLLTIFDYYIYLMLGDEWDSLGKLAGTPFFQKAKTVATIGKSVISENASGWDARLIKADEFLDIRYEDYRVMKDYFYEGKSNFENGEIETARKNVKKAIDLLEKIIVKNTTSYHPERFLQRNYLEFCKIFDKSGERKVFDRLASMDSKNKDTYIKYRDKK